MKSILLIEPPYRNKYPPIGLMKIATYHKMLGDEVTFYLRNVSDLVLSMAIKDILLFYEGCNVVSDKTKSLIEQFIKSGNSHSLETLLLPVTDPDYNIKL